MPRLIIDYPDDMPILDALQYIHQHVEPGRISENKNGAHFCWVSRFERDGITVVTRPRHKEQKSDSLSIIREK